MSVDTRNRVARVDRRARIAGTALFLTDCVLFANLVPWFPEIKADIGIINAFHAVWSVGAIMGGAMAAGAIALGQPVGVPRATQSHRTTDDTGRGGPRRGPPRASLRRFPVVGYPAGRSRPIVPSRSRWTRSGRMKWPPSGSCAS